MRYVGFSPMPPELTGIEIETPHGMYDLHNFGYIVSIAFEPPDALSVAAVAYAPFIRSSIDSEAVRVDLRFEEVSGLSVTQHADNPPEAATWEHLFDFGPGPSSPRVEFRTGTLEFGFDASTATARVRPHPVIGAGEFQKACSDAVGPVMSRFGFQRVELRGHAVRFETSTTFADFGYDAARSHTLDIRIGRTGRHEPPLPLDDVLRATGCPAERVLPLVRMQSGDPVVLCRLLARVAAVMEDCGPPFLDSDAVLRRAIEQREARTTDSERAAPETDVLAEAEAAWAAKDFKRYRDLLHPMRDRLPDTQRRRLDYADRHM